MNARLAVHLELQTDPEITRPDTGALGLNELATAVVVVFVHVLLRLPWWLEAAFLLALFCWLRATVGLGRRTRTRRRPAPAQATMNPSPVHPAFDLTNVSSLEQENR